MKLTRRRFLQGAATTVGGSALLQSLGGCTHFDRLFSVDRGRYDDEVVIIGAGAAGLMAAYQLKKNQIPYRLYEASPRLGGRVYTLEDFNDAGQFVELGAESFNADHRLIQELCRELRLPVQPLGEPAGVEKQLYYLDGRISTSAEFAREMQGLAQKIVRHRLEVTADLDPDEAWRELPGSAAAQKWDAVPLSVYLTELGGDPRGRAQRLFKRACETQFGVEAEKISALQFLMSLDPERREGSPSRVEGGMGRLMRTLYERVCGVLPDFFVRPEHQLAGIAADGSYFTCRFKTPQGLRTVEAKHVIWALPPTAFQSVAGWDHLEIAPERRRRVSATKLAPQARVVLGFKERFWNQKSEGPPASSGTWLGEFTQQSFWEATRNQAGKKGALSFSVSGDEAMLAGPMNVDKALDDLTLVYRRARVYYENRNTVYSWARQPHAGGSLSYFAPGMYLPGLGSFQAADYEGRMVFAGEHTDPRFHGTVEGALQSGRRAAEQITQVMGGMTNRG